MKTVEPLKVVRGKNALPGEIPWNIEIYYRHNLYQGCGGTLISNNSNSQPVVSCEMFNFNFLITLLY